MNNKLLMLFIFALLFSAFASAQIDICSGPTKVAVLVNDECPP